MGKLIRFYFEETKAFFVTLIGFYILLNIIAVISKRNSGISFFGIVVLSIAAVIYLIKFNLYDTGKDTFTLISMTDSPAAKILLSKLAVSYIYTLIIIAVEYVFLLIYQISSYSSTEFFWGGMLMFPVKVLFLLTIVISYIAYPAIWIKVFKLNKIWRKVLAAAAVTVWFIINITIRNSVFIFSINTVQSGRHFGGSSLSIWSILWHLTWCIVFFTVTVYLQKKKIDQI